MDRSFGFDVPDFWRDRALTWFGSKGGFYLRIIDAGEHMEFIWEPQNSADDVARRAGLYSILVAASYPADLRLVARVRPSF
jgi:hypothetical protein